MSEGMKPDLLRLEDVEPSEYDFLDFGAGIGTPLERCERLFGGRGLGIDIDRKKIRQAQQEGSEVVYGDILTLPRKKLVRYVCMDNFLEHLPDFATARAMITVAAAVAEEFLYIVHPSFKDEAYLKALGLKQYWHDWTGHPAHLLLPNFVSMLREAGAPTMKIAYGGGKPIYDSNDPSILPLSAPVDQHHYECEAHGPKPFVKFDKPVFRQIRIHAYLEDPAPGGRISEL